MNMGKKNLDSILIKDEKVLPTKDDETLSVAKHQEVKPKKELESKVISIKITETEYNNIREKAGRLVPMGTYVKDYIRTKTDLFTKPSSNEK